jgi:predicted site-specific integrase-resolvase
MVFSNDEFLNLNREEAAEFLKIKPQTLAVWATKGTGPAPTKVGRRVVYQMSELQRFLTDNTAPRKRGGKRL